MTDPMNVEVTTRGTVAAAMVTLAEELLADLEGIVQGPVTAVRVVLREEENPSIVETARAEADMRLSGHLIRAKVAAPTMLQAINDLVARLRRQMRRHSDRMVTDRRTPGVLGEMSAGPRPPRSWREPGDREVIRRKSFTLEPIDAIQAAADMAALDHDFFLFQDLDTGADAVIYLRDDDRLAVIAPQGAGSPDVPPGPVRESSRYSQPLELEAAVSKMDALNHRFLFFTDAETDRGAVLYLRHDGHYGLIEPAR